MTVQIRIDMLGKIVTVMPWSSSHGRAAEVLLAMFVVGVYMVLLNLWSLRAGPGARVSDPRSVAKLRKGEGSESHLG